SALRTTETYKLLAGEVEGYPSPRLEDELYEASPRTLLTKLQGLAETVERVIVVGHEPVMSSLAHMLDDQRGPGSGNLSLGIPTATAVVLDVPVEWAELERQSATVRAVLRPSED
ncbi:MAG: phosphohistidine phosphatase, partial [bacterium]|nr:phosphohistidine phosphatase [bacterium]